MRRAEEIRARMSHDDLGLGDKLPARTMSQESESAASAISDCELMQSISNVSDTSGHESYVLADAYSLISNRFDLLFTLVPLFLLVAQPHVWIDEDFLRWFLRAFDPALCNLVHVF